jgi:hypothetical protein
VALRPPLEDGDRLEGEVGELRRPVAGGVLDEDGPHAVPLEQVGRGRGEHEGVDASALHRGHERLAGADLDEGGVLLGVVAGLAQQVLREELRHRPRAGDAEGQPPQGSQAGVERRSRRDPQPGQDVVAHDQVHRQGVHHGVDEDRVAPLPPQGHDVVQRQVDELDVAAQQRRDAQLAAVDLDVLPG